VNFFLNQISLDWRLGVGREEDDELIIVITPPFKSVYCQNKKMLVRTRIDRYDFPFQFSERIVSSSIPSSYSGCWAEGGSKVSRPRLDNCSAFKYEVVNPVLLPALFVVLGTEGFLLTEADSPDAVGGNSLLH
jgi:hypothetical protein